MNSARSLGANHAFLTKKTLIVFAVTVTSLIVAVVTACAVYYNSDILATTPSEPLTQNPWSQPEPGNGGFNLCSPRVSVKVPDRGPAVQVSAAHSAQSTASRVAVAKRKRVAVYVFIGVALFLIIGALIGLTIFLTIFDGANLLFGDGGGAGGQVAIGSVEGDVEGGGDSKAEPVSVDLQPKPDQPYAPLTPDTTQTPTTQTPTTQTPTTQTPTTQTPNSPATDNSGTNIVNEFTSFITEAAGPWIRDAILDHPMMSAFLIFSTIMATVGLVRKQPPMAMVGPAIVALYGVYVAFGAIQAVFHAMWITFLLVLIARIRCQRQSWLARGCWRSSLQCGGREHGVCVCGLAVVLVAAIRVEVQGCLE